MNVDIWQLMMSTFFWEDEVMLYAFVCLSKEGGKLRADGGEIIECVQVVNNKGGAGLNALELFLPEIEPAGLTEFMCYSAGDGLRVYVR
jgi:hypothetical protein